MTVRQMKLGLSYSVSEWVSNKGFFWRCQRISKCQWIPSKEFQVPHWAKRRERGNWWRRPVSRWLEIHTLPRWSGGRYVPLHMAASWAAASPLRRRRLRTGTLLLPLQRCFCSRFVCFLTFLHSRLFPAVSGSCFKKSPPAMWWGNALVGDLVALASAGHKSWRRRRTERKFPSRPSWPTSSTMLRPWRLRGRRGKTSMRKSSRWGSPFQALLLHTCLQSWKQLHHSWKLMNASLTHCWSAQKQGKEWMHSMVGQQENIFHFWVFSLHHRYHFHSCYLLGSRMQWMLKI